MIFKLIPSFLITLLPLIIWPFGSLAFEPIKIILSEVLIDLIIVYYFSTHNQFNFKLFFKDRRILIAIFLVSLIGLIFSNTSTTLLGNTFRLQGTFLLWQLLGWSVVVSKLKIKKPSPWFANIGLIGLFISIFLINANVDGRAVGTIGEPNSLAGVAIYLWPLTSLPIIGAILTGLTIYLTGSRSGLIAFIVQIVFLSLIKSKKVSLNKSFGISLIILIVSLVLPFFQPQVRFEDRTQIWQTALAAGLDKPILGYGFGNIEQALHQSAIKLNNTLQYAYLDSTHNLLLDWFVQGGIVGLSLLISLIFVRTRRLIKTNQTQNLAILLGLLAVMSFNPVSIVILVAFWWVISQ